MRHQGVSPMPYAPPKTAAGRSSTHALGTDTNLLGQHRVKGRRIVVGQRLRGHAARAHPFVRAPFLQVFCVPFPRTRA